MSQEELRYFVPNIEDIRVGYEYEVYRSGTNIIWDKKKIESINELTFGVSTFKQNVAEGWIRTLYLTKEQIEAEGWKWKDEYKLFHKEVIVDENLKYWFDIKLDGSNVIIEKSVVKSFDMSHKLAKASDVSWAIVYNGYCPSINEFKYITNKLLKITK